VLVDKLGVSASKAEGGTRHWGATGPSTFGCWLRMTVTGNDSTLEGRRGYGESAPGEEACQAGQHGGTCAAGQ